MIVRASILKTFSSGYRVFPKNSIPFPKNRNPQKRQNRHFIFGRQKCPFYGHSQKQNPKNKLPKMAFRKISISKGKPVYPPEAKLSILSPFFPKTELRRKPCSVTDYFQAIFTPCMLAIPLFFKAFSPLILHLKTTSE